MTTPVETEFDQPNPLLLEWLKDAGFRPVAAVEYPGSSGARSSRPIVERLWYRPGEDHHPGFLMRVQGDGESTSAMERVLSLYANAVRHMSYFKLPVLGGWVITANVTAGKVSTVMEFGRHEYWGEAARIGHLALSAFRHHWWLDYLAENPPKKGRGRPRKKRQAAPKETPDTKVPEPDTASG